MAFPDNSKGKQFALAGAVIGGGGAFLPWIEASAFGLSMSITGIQGGDGYIVLVAAGILIASVVVGNWGRKSRALGGIATLVIAGIGFIYVADPTLGIEFETAERRQIAQAVLEPAFGLYVTALGGVLGLVGVWMGPDGDGSRPRQPEQRYSRGDDHRQRPPQQQPRQQQGQHPPGQQSRQQGPPDQRDDRPNGNRETPQRGPADEHDRQSRSRHR